MRSNLKPFFKKYCLVFLLEIIINLPIVILGVYRTDKTVTLKGDTTLVEDFVEIEGAYPQQGSLSSIYVISMDHSTILQNFFVGLSKTSEVEDLPTSYLHFTDAELNEMGRIQHSSSITYALIHSYTMAAQVNSNVHIEYKIVAAKIQY